MITDTVTLSAVKKGGKVLTFISEGGGVYHLTFGPTDRYINKAEGYLTRQIPHFQVKMHKVLYLLEKIVPFN